MLPLDDKFLRIPDGIALEVITDCEASRAPIPVCFSVRVSDSVWRHGSPAGRLATLDTVVSYNMAFESARIKELADRVPSQKEELLSVTARMIDLLDTVQDNYYHQDFRGSLSIKSVLPVMVPSMAYEGMAVANGTDAIEAAREMLFGGHSKDLVDEIRANLLAYCGQDTLAMVEIFKKLQEIAKSG